MPSLRILCALAALLLITSSSVQAASRQMTPGSDLESRIEATLADHLDGERIAHWRDTLVAGTLEREAADWILAWLPLSDQAALDLPLLREHVEEAAAIYRAAPWREQLSHDLWLHFVVPHRVSQEPAQAWRARFRAEIWPRVKDAPDMESAALAVNRWCREQATFKSTNGRDQGPLTTVARGIGRCEEEMILTICALRAVGIPARSCATPYWSFTDNNHAWVETWADGRWWYLGGCEPDRCLNRAWFTKSASRTGFVRSVAYGEFDPAPEPLYRSEDGSTIINSTGVYTDPIRVTARLAGEWADPEGWIHVNVLNFGSLRAVAKLRSGDTIALGPGEYAFTSGDGETLLLEVAGGRGGDVVEVVLDEEDRYDLASSPGFWLRYPESDARPARDLDLVGDEARADMQRGVALRDGDREKLRTAGAEERKLLDALPADQRARFEAAMEKPFTRVSTLFALLADYPEGAGRAALLDFLDAADDKDLLELDRRAVRSHIDLALAVRDRLGLAMPDSLFAQDLLACRIAREPGGPWREGLPLLDHDGDAQSLLIRLLEDWSERTREVERGFMGAPLNPAQSWALGLGTEQDLKVGLVGLLRRNGFPARYRHGKVEAWSGEWQELDALTGTILENGPEGESVESGRMEIAITRGGTDYAEAESYRHFNLCRHEEGLLSSPWWDPGLGAQDWDSGEFILCSANRVPGGSIYGRLRAFTVKAGETTRVELPIDIEAGWDPGEAFFSGLSSEAFREALAASGEEATGDRLTFVFERGEPALRMIEALGRVQARLVSLGIESRAVLVADGDHAEEPKALMEALRKNGFGELTHIERGQAERLQGESEFEPVTALELNGVIRYLRSDFNTAIDGNIHMALDLYGQD